MDLIAEIDLYDLIRFVRFLAKRLLIDIIPISFR